VENRARKRGGAGNPVNKDIIHMLHPAHWFIFLLTLLMTAYQVLPALAVKDEKEIIAGIPANFPPHYYLDEKKGVPQGFAIDVMEEIARRTGIKVKYVVYSDWDKIIEAIKKGEVELVPNIGITAERAEFMDFSSPVETLHIVIFVRATTTDIKNINDLKGREVAVMKSNKGQFLMEERGGSMLQIYVSQEEAFLSLISGGSDALVYPEPPIKLLAQKIGLGDRIKVVGEPLLEVKRSIAVRKGNPELLKALDDEVTAFIKTPRYAEIYAEWYGKSEPYWTARRVAVFGGVFLAFVIVTSVIWRYLSVMGLNKKLQAALTERKKAEEALRATNEQLRALVQSSPVAIIALDPDGDVKLWNPASERVFGWTEAEALDRFLPYVPQEKRAEHEALRARVLGGEGFMDVEVRRRRKDGTPVDLSVSTAPLRDAEGRITGIMSVNVDITDRKKAEEALRESEERFRELAESLPLTVFEMDLQGRFTYVNRAALEKFGYLQQDVDADLNMVQVIAPGDRARALEEIARRMAGIPEGYIEFQGLRKDGTTFPITVASSPIFREGKPVGLLGILTDISERKQLEEERLKAQKLESIGTLAGGIAHDFNNLLQGVFGYISMAKLTFDQKEKSLAMLHQAEEALHMTVNLTNQLLTFSKGGRPVKKLIRIEPTVENAVKFALSGSHTDYRLDFASDLRPVEADAGQLAQVIQNIVLNANEAMAGRGTVNIDVRNMDIPAETNPLLPEGGRFVLIDIQDTGIGISEENLTKIFDPYFTTKQKGSGLGLATSYSIIKNHGGVIEVKSEQNRGTIFTICLPASEGAEMEAETASTSSVGTKKGRILLMDDEAVVRKIAREMIVALGHEVEGAEDGKKAIELFGHAMKIGRPFDLVILDLTVKGGMGGEEAIQKIREIDPEVRAVVSSGYADSLVLADYREHGFSAFLNKPYKIDALRDCLNSFLT
jgi:two-component system, cell cycle sensor histidine kinase and response regulator CckA